MAGQRATELDARIGSRIREARKQAGVSPGELAEALGFSKAQLSKYETGENCINASRLQVLAAYLGRPVVSFYDQGEEAPERFPLARALIAQVTATSLELDSVLAGGGA